MNLTKFIEFFYIFDSFIGNFYKNLFIAERIAAW